MSEIATATADEGAGARPLKGDLTQGPILGTLLRFSLPLLAANVLQTLNGSINSIWVGRLIGEAALAATANANMILFLLYAVIFGLGNATTIRVGHFYGARDLAAARRVFGAGIGFCAALAILTGLAGGLGAKPLLALLATPQESRAAALAYLQVLFFTVPFGTVSMMMGMGLRGAGDSRTPLYAMIVTALLDAALNPLLILGLGPVPALGIAGSAAATAVSNLMGLLLMIAVIYARDLPLRLRGREFAWLFPGRATTAYIVTKGLPMGAQMLALSSAGLVMIGLVNRQGLDAAAAYGAALQLWNYLQMPAFAIGMAVSAMVAQAIGAGLHRRVDNVTRVGLIANLAMTSALGVLIVGFGRPLLALFLGGDSTALPIGVHILQVCSWSFVLGSIVLIFNGTMRAYGAVMLPLIIMVLTMFPARIGFYFAARPWLGEEAVWWAYPASTAVSVALTWLAYAKGSWRGKRVGMDEV